jgi:allophanate hydrolase
VFAGTVADATTVAAIASGPAGPWDRTAPAPGPRVPPHALRLGVPDPAELDFAGDEAMRAAYLAAVESARAVVASVVSIPLAPFLEAGALLYEGALVAERLADLADFLTARPDSVLPVTRRILESGAGYDASELFRHQHRVRELRSVVDAAFVDVDAMLLPTVPTTFTIAELLAEPVRHNLTLGRFTQFVNVLDLAAVALPAGLTTDGRPAGVTVIGPAFSDETLAVLADHLAPRPEVTVLPPPAPASMVLTVVGRHLRGESRHYELIERGARFEGAAQTAPEYRLHLLPSGLPGLVRTPTGGAAIDVELWRLPLTAVGGFLAGVGAPLSIGRVLLADGTEHAGFLCEAYAAEGALDITEYGGWRAYQASITRAAASTSESQAGGGG